MIAVSNISEEKCVPYSRKGLQHYRVQLNQIHLAEFTHMAEDGMEECLRKAAQALDTVDIDEKIRESRRALYREVEKAFSKEAREGTSFEEKPLGS